MALIDKETIRAKIERLKDTAWRRADNRYGREDANTYEAWAGAYEKVLEILDTIPEQPVEGLDVTDFCKPIDPDIAQCVADHFWEMIGEESTNKKPVEGLEEEYVRFVRTDHHIYQDLIGNGGIDLARHFAEWGKNNLK